LWRAPPRAGSPAGGGGWAGLPGAPGGGGAAGARGAPAGAPAPATPVPHAREIVGRIPRARLAVLDAAAHLANVEQPEQVCRLLSGHFQEGRDEE
ncbi:alpha/beta fold hydrolase, partial [Micromonospora parva]